MKGWSYEARIARAEQLAKAQPAARELLGFYGRLAALQKSVFEDQSTSVNTGLNSLLPYFDPLIELVRRNGTQLLAKFAADQLQTESAREQLLIACWEGDAPSEPGRFYGRVLVQPFAEHLAQVGQTSGFRGLPSGPQSLCPFCSSSPVAAVLRGEGEGAKRSLLCSLCSTEWPFRRVLCPNCGQEDKDRLPVYSAPDFPHIRVEACDVCNVYAKSIDLTKDGHAVPVVDELGSAVLNLWADEHGYSKIETGLLGM